MKTAGWWGLDRWLLPAVGTPWQAGGLFRWTKPAAEPTTETGSGAGGGSRAAGGGRDGG
ncbi:MAG TPA: hypothetical protein VI855_02045 [Dehalococcoidia bacterium]|nr:hypothetical protein [Dehalococcoidia bacterium]